MAGKGSMSELAKSGAAPTVVEEAPERMVEELAARTLSGPALVVFCVCTATAIAIALNQLLNLQLFAGIVFIENRYLFLLSAVLLPLVFLAYAVAPKWSAGSVPWYDWVLALASAAVLGWFAWQAQRILEQGWEYSAPTQGIVASAIACALIIEGLRGLAGPRYRHRPGGPDGGGE